MKKRNKRKGRLESKGFKIIALEKINHSLLAAYLFSFRVLLDILRQLSHTKLVIEEAKRKHMSSDIFIEQHQSKIVF